MNKKKTQNIESYEYLPKDDEVQEFDDVEEVNASGKRAKLPKKHGHGARVHTIRTRQHVTFKKLGYEHVDTHVFLIYIYIIQLR